MYASGIFSADIFTAFFYLQVSIALISKALNEYIVIKVL